jgi:hypothetical protein
VLRAEAARRLAGDAPDVARARPAAEHAEDLAESLKEAIRRAYLLLVHLVDAEALARDLSACESRGLARSRS